jgi:hypothetical protein
MKLYFAQIEINLQILDLTARRHQASEHVCECVHIVHRLRESYGVLTERFAPSRLSSVD